MKHIGGGWQFDAYAQGNLVIKVTTSPIRMAIRVLKSYPALVMKPIRLAKKVRKQRDLREATLAQLARRDVDTRLLANFREEKGQYLQDRVTPLGDALAEGRDPYWLMDRYLDSIRHGWRSGFVETSFNFTVNHGLTPRGRVVVLDVGEMSFDRKEALSLLHDRLWETSFSTASLAPEVRSYLLERMDRMMTSKRVSRMWRDAAILPSRGLASDRPAVRRDREVTVPTKARRLV